MNVNHERSIANDSNPFSDILLELILESRWSYRFSSLRDTRFAKSCLKDDMSERVNETAAADT